MPDSDDEKPDAKAAREAEELKFRVEVAKKCTDADFKTMLAAERWPEDKVTILKARASALFSHGFLEMAATMYTRAIGLHACEGTPASHVLYANRSACRSGFGDYDGGLMDAVQCIDLNPTWPKGYLRKGAALHGLFRWDEAVRAYELGLAHDPSLGALTDGLQDALRRRKAAAGEWEEMLAGATWPDPLPEDVRRRADAAQHPLLVECAPGRALVVQPSGSADGAPPEAMLCVCDATHGCVRMLDPTTLEERQVLGTAGSADGELGKPVCLAAHGDCLAVADGSDLCRVSLFTSRGGFLRHVGERASRFASVAVAGQFEAPPAYVALTEGHLFVLEGGFASHVHVLDPSSGAPMGLIVPPFNVLACSPDVRRYHEMGEAGLATGAPLSDVAKLRQEHPARPVGCLTRLCCVSDEGLYVEVAHGGQHKVLRLSQTGVGAGGAPETADGGAAGGKGRGEELAYKKGFLLG